MKVTQSCPTLCDPMDDTVHGIFQTRILEWVAFPFSRESSQPKDRTQVSCIAGGFFTSWATREAHEYWSRQPIHSSVDLPDPGIKLGSPGLQVDSLPIELSGKPKCYKGNDFRKWPMLGWRISLSKVVRVWYLTGDQEDEKESALGRAKRRAFKARKLFAKSLSWE